MELRIAPRRQRWRRHGVVLIPPILANMIASGLIFAVISAVKADTLMLLVPLSLLPSICAYLRWQRQCVSLEDGMVLFEWGVVLKRSRSFPLRDVDALETYQPLLGQLLNFGDAIIHSGQVTETLRTLHPFDSFLRTYKAHQNRAVLTWDSLPRELRGREEREIIESPFRRVAHEVELPPQRLVYHGPELKDHHFLLALLLIATLWLIVFRWMIITFGI